MGKKLVFEQHFLFCGFPYTHTVVTTSTTTPAFAAGVRAVTAATEAASALEGTMVTAQLPAIVTNRPQVTLVAAFANLAALLLIIS